MSIAKFNNRNDITILFLNAAKTQNFGIWHVPLAPCWSCSYFFKDTCHGLPCKQFMLPQILEYELCWEIGGSNCRIMIKENKNWTIEKEK